MRSETAVLKLLHVISSDKLREKAATRAEVQIQSARQYKEVSHDRYITIAFYIHLAHHRLGQGATPKLDEFNAHYEEAQDELIKGKHYRKASVAEPRYTFSNNLVRAWTLSHNRKAVAGIESAHGSQQSQETYVLTWLVSGYISLY